MLDTIRECIISMFDKYLGNDYILFIFGSFAKNRIDRASDIDLAIYTKNAPSSLLMEELREELGSKVPTLRTIDLVNLADPMIDEKLLENILKEGIIWKRPKNSDELLRNLRKRLRSSRK